jgi:hypothetical protein
MSLANAFEFDDEWDDCDHQLVTSSSTHRAPSRREIIQCVCVDGNLSGFNKTASRKSKRPLPAEIDPRCIPSDINYQTLLSAQESSIPKPEFVAKLHEVYHLDEASSLPRSVLLAANNRLSEDQIVQIQRNLLDSGNNTLPYFVCGAFLFPSILLLGTRRKTKADLLQMASSMTPGLVRCYTRHAVRGRSFPATAPSKNANDFITGMVVFGIADSERERIHVFQSGMFELRRVKAIIELAQGSLSTIECAMYVWKGSSDDLVPTEERQWKIGDLMESSWHLENLKAFENEERKLSEA